MSRATETADRGVAAGAALLDERIPQWWQRIDVGQLDLADSCRCVLGQLYPVMLPAELSYDRGRVALDLTPETAQQMGFNIGDDTEDEPSFADLDEAWLRVVKQRHEDGLA